MGGRIEGAALSRPTVVKAASAPKQALVWPAVPPQLRRQPIRDALLAYLKTPRAVADIARHIGRPVPTTTGHLAAMRRLGLVKRLGYAVYAVASYQGPAPSWQRPRPSQPAPVRATVRAALRDAITFAELVRVTGLPESDVRGAIDALWMAGLVAGDEASGYRLMRALTSRKDKAPRPCPEPALASPGARRRHANAVRGKAA